MILGLNNYLQPLDSPIARNQGATSSFKFDAENEAGVISTSKIRRASIGSAQIATAAIGTAQIGTISFNQVNGGTAMLGGVGNGDGLLTVNNAGGTEVVRLDNTGIVISAGTITGVQVTTTVIQSGTIQNAFIGTSQVTGGSVSNAFIGTPQVTGGTLNPSVYQASGTVGATGTVEYVKNLVPGDLGTIIFKNGLAISIV